MNRLFGVVAFFVGLAAISWVGFGYIGSNPLALAMTLLIGAFYAMGALELRGFHQATSTLARALAAIPENLQNLGEWIGQVPPSLQNPVRLRIEGERIHLPGPAMTPYLVGLLVLLGMLGTFLGMVVTLNGAVTALESTTDLPTIRAALSAPVKGLGLAFGTSVAGVAASAMLGLLSALCRRERLQAAQILDTRIATVLRRFSRAHQRDETFQAFQLQARAMPELADRLQSMMAQMERQNLALNERLLAGQEGFYRGARADHQALAASVDRSLKESLAECARVAGETIRPVVETTMAGIAREASSTHERTAETVQRHLDGVSTRFDAAVGTVSETWREALAQHQRSSEDLSGNLRQSLAAWVANLERQSASLMGRLGEVHAAWQADGAAGEQRRIAALTESLESIGHSLQREWQQSGAQTLRQQEQVCKTLERTALDIHARAEAHAGRTIAELGRMVQTASEAPRLAAEMMGALREKLADSSARDNELLEERRRIMAELGQVLEVAHRTADEQRQAIDSLVQSSAALLQHAGRQFAEKIDVESTRMAAAAAQVTGGAVEVSSLGEAFGLAVQLFGESSAGLVAGLQRVEASLNQSMARSDEQLAYYVAQAREIVDLSILSQRQILEDLKQVASRQATLADEVA